MDSPDLKQLTAIVKTFERPRSVARLIRSLKRFYPQLRVLVADDSFQPGHLRGVDCVHLPSDVGASAGRNALLARLRTRYFLVLDDDVEIHRHSRLEQLLQPVASGQLDLAAGDLVHCRRSFLFTRRRPQPGHGTFELARDELTLQPGYRTATEQFHMCDIAHNFFVARTDKVRSLGGWDDELRVDEREEFFLRAFRQGLRVGYCPDVTAWHWQDRPKNYVEYRLRQFKPLALSKMGLSRLVDLDGQVHTSAHSLRKAA